MNWTKNTRARKFQLGRICRPSAVIVNQHGFTYIALLTLIAVMGVGLAATEEVWYLSMKREREQELLFVGNQFRHAIAMYYSHAPGQLASYPMHLEDMLKDPRYPGTKRYLRTIYLDPITNSNHWELVKGGNGEIIGVHSSSVEEPIKKSNFSLANQNFEGKTKYSDWVFMIAVNNPRAPTSLPPTSIQLKRINP